MDVGCDAHAHTPNPNKIELIHRIKPLDDDCHPLTVRGINTAARAPNHELK
jgi:hypothetical protein